MDYLYHWHDGLSKKIVSFDRAYSFLLGKILKGAGGWGFCRATANALAFLMDLLADYSKSVLEIMGKVILYQRRDHRVSLGYSPCSTSNVQVLGRCPRPALHVVPCFLLVWFFVD